MSAITEKKYSIKKDLLNKLKLTPDEYLKIIELIDREPNEVELHMFSVMWSEHCCYKNSKALLKTFPTKNKYVVVGPGENAGVVDLGDGIKIAFKIESHNRPTAVEPFQGATTGVGGILRDIFTMGARPIAILDSLRFGDLNIPRSRYLFSSAVSGISHYGNCTGVPNIGGESYFYPTYNENPLVNAMAIGLIETKEIVKSGASGIGNPVLYVGSKTGRDGLGGASFASSGLTDESHRDRPAVQVGDPFCGKILIEACLEAFKTDYVVAAQDMGAAGLTCSTSEMAAKGNVGIEIDLDKVPTRTTLTPVEYMLSESQERMLFVVKKGFEKEIEKVFGKWGLDCVCIGEITEGKNVVVKYKGKTVVNMPAGALVSDTPIYKREAKEPEYFRENKKFDQNKIPDLKANEVIPILKTLLSSPNICSKKWVYSKYDHQVQTNTVIKPGSTAGVIRIKNEPANRRAGEPAKEKGLAVACDGNSAYVYLDPYLGSKIAVCEAARNVSCTGAKPIAITDNLNFGNPEKPEIYWQLSESTRGIKEACIELDTPVTGGNVSLYNESNGTDIWPTPVIGMVGYLEDIELAIDGSFKNAGDVIIMLGENKNEIGASEYLFSKTNEIKGKVPGLDINLEKKVQLSVRELIERRLIKSANDCSIGGLLITLCESAFPNNLGFALNMESCRDGVAPSLRTDAILFGETQSRIVISTSEKSLADTEKFLKEENCPYQILGKVQEKFVEIKSLNIKSEVKELKMVWEKALPDLLS
ncbi:MAG: phosphoribosylformylglycinamidine synthase II [Candidatus Melainabacteria bacterium RIFCSPHIGHO2_02_FULL_34_12]|nr:MAG: phosphoribosylformylglycinamidine synthase II [Candidatus Melainabacteria bacterium RIFCSPHIGHO2_02_FULL_34_12]